MQTGLPNTSNFIEALGLTSACETFRQVPRVLGYPFLLKGPSQRGKRSSLSDLWDGSERSWSTCAILILSPDTMQLLPSMQKQGEGIKHRLEQVCYFNSPKLTICWGWTQRIETARTLHSVFATLFSSCHYFCCLLLSLLCCLLSVPSSKSRGPTQMGGTIPTNVGAFKHRAFKHRAIRAFKHRTGTEEFDFFFYPS